MATCKKNVLKSGYPSIFTLANLSCLKRLLLPLFLAFAVQGFAQTVMDIPLKNIKEEKPLADFLSELEKSHPVRFFFLDEWLTPFRVDSHFNGYTLQRLLEELLHDGEVDFNLMHNYAVIFIKDPSKALDRQNILHTATVKKKKIEQQIIGNIRNFAPGKKLVVQGTVRSQTDMAISGVLVSVEDLGINTSTDNNGRYSLTMVGGEHVMSFRNVSYDEKIIDLRIYESGMLNIGLEEAPILLEEVVVSDQALLNSRVGQSTLKMKDVRRAPAFLGEVDVIKSIQGQAGVTTVGEVASGFNVRGGGVDQNLVLYDGTPIFNTSHALGFFTAFNSDVVSQVSFYRGGIPAEYGGRVSSVLSITSQEGNKEKWTASGGIGIISSHLTVGGPIKKDTTTLILSARSSYSDWMLNAVKSNHRNLQNSSVSFYDGSLKFNHRFNSKTQMVLSGYTSSDRFTLSNDTIYSWKNYAASLRVDHTFSDRFFSSVSLAMGRYAYQLKEEDRGNAFELDYSITYPSLKLDFNYNGKHEFSFGIHNTLYDFSPGALKPTSAESTTRRIKLENEKSLETAVYLSDGFYWRNNIFVEAGLRYSLFNRLGAATVYHYRPDAPRETRNITDSVHYNTNESVKIYHGAEPRLSVRVTLTPRSSIKLGYNRIYQYIHLVTNTAAVAPVDIWQSSNTHFKPQVADQISLGYFRNLGNNTYETFVEAYFKHVQNTLDFKDGADLILNRNLETSLLPGTGESFGVEGSVTKVKGRLIGSANYTFSRSLRVVNGSYPIEKINEGDMFPSNFDQPHVVNLSWRYNISRRYFFSGNFTYHTGRPLSLPQSAYTIDGSPVANFSERNKYRMPDYHRLDVALILEGNHKRKKFLDGTWSISFYNAYARKNVYSVFFQTDKSGTLRPYKLSVIGTIIPSLSYNFKI
jgi:hypothetical protein